MNTIIPANNSITQTDLGQALASFLRMDVAAGDASQKTLDSYLSEFKQYCTWCATEGISPAAATVDDLKAYRSYLVNNFRRSSCATKFAILKRIFDAVVWSGRRLDNPARGLKVPRDKTQREDQIKYLNLPGFKKLLSLPDNPRDRAILTLMGYHGLRVMEVSGLSLDDLHLEGDQPYLSVTGKGSKMRKVYLTERSAAALAAWLAVRQAAPGERAVFVVTGNRGRGERIGTRGLREMTDRYLTTAGLKAEGVSCHSLRHSHATWALHGGAKLTAISAAMGHSSITTTQVYAKLVDAINENPARYLDSLLAD